MSTTRDIAFRLSASAAIGGGHAMRCLTLAAELARRGARCRFYVSPGAVEAVPALARSGLVVREANGSREALALARADAVGALDAVVFDDYGIDAEEETRWRSIARRIVVLDDLADRLHDCDILLDQTLGRDAANYTRLVPSSARILAGARHALLRPEFARLRASALARRAGVGEVRRVLVSFGLTDSAGLSALALRALVGRGVAIDVLVGAAARGLPALHGLVAAHPGAVVHVDASDVAGLTAAADLAIGAGGSSAWERCCLGLPTVMAVVADNQRRVAASLAAAGAARVLARVDEAAIGAATAALAEDATARRDMAERAAAVCDGTGAARLADAILDAPPRSS